MATPDLHEKAFPAHAARGKRKGLLALLLLTGPALVWFSVFMIWPMLKMFYNSTLQWNGIVSPQRFIGLHNYVTLIQDYHFHNALINNGIQLLATLVILFPPAIFIGFFLSQRRGGYRLFRTVFFSPNMMSVAAIALMYLGVFMPGGMLNSLLRSVGLGGLDHYWLADPHTALGSIISINLIGGIGFYAVLLFAAFSNIPAELYDAAKLDGASLSRVLWRIAVPLTKEFLGVLIILQFLWVLVDSAQQILLLTQGGPGDHTLTLSFYAYFLAFGGNWSGGSKLGYSQALSVVVFVIGIAGMLTIRRATARD